MNISIFGLGYVGAVSLACLARDGHHVIGVDVDQAKLDLIASGKTPVVEEGMMELIAEAVGSGRVSVTRDVADAVHATELSLICVGTPSAPNGSQDQTAIVGLARELGVALRENMVFICKPSAITADNQYICTWGDTVVVTKKGGRRLGKRPHDLAVSGE